MPFLSKRLVIFFTLWLAGSGNAFFLDWFWGGQKQQERGADDLKKEKESRFRYDVPLPVQYEGRAEDKKFAEDVKKYTMDLTSQSVFDTCHREVIAKIKSTCLTATEEDLSKLSVNLLSCHSEHGDKGKFPCTEEMRLRECTQGMDTDMWTAYHVMNLKTRALCYAGRQLSLHDQNREKVNQLAVAVQHQFLSMLSVKEKQENLELMTYGTKNVMAKTQDALHLYMEVLNATHEDLDKLFGLKIADLVGIKASVDEKRRLYAKYRMDVEKNLESVLDQLKTHADVRKEDYFTILTTAEKIKETVVSTLELTECKVAMQQELMDRLMAEREGVLDALSNVSIVLEPVQSLWQHVGSFLGNTSGHVDDGKLVDVVVNILLHVPVLLVSVLSCTLYDAGLLSHAFTFAVYMNVVVMYVCGEVPVVGIHVLAAVFAILRAVQWFMALVYSFLQCGAANEETGNVYMLDSEAFASVSGGKGLFSSAKESAAGLVGKLWQPLRALFKKIQLLDQPDTYSDDGRSEDVGEEDLLDECESTFNDSNMSFERGSSYSLPASSIGRRPVSLYGGKHVFERGSDSSRRTPTPVRQLPDRREESPHSPLKPLCSFIHAGGAHCRNKARYGHDTCFVHSELSPVRQRLR